MILLLDSFLLLLDPLLGYPLHFHADDRAGSLAPACACSCPWRPNTRLRVHPVSR